MKGKRKKPQKYYASYEKLFAIIKSHGDTWLSFSQKSNISQGELHNLRCCKNIYVDTLIVTIDKLEKLYGKAFKIIDIVEIKRK